MCQIMVVIFSKLTLCAGPNRSCPLKVWESHDIPDSLSFCAEVGMLQGELISSLLVRLILLMITLGKYTTASVREKMTGDLAILWFGR